MSFLRTLAPYICLVVLGAAPSVHAADPSAEKAAVEAADRDFSRAVVERDVEAFKARIAEDAVFVGGSGVLRGRDAIAAGWAALLAEDRQQLLSWAPHYVEVAASADLAYTVGEYELTHTGPDGESSTGKGTYVTAWKKGSDGRWRAVADGGSPPEPTADSE